MDTSQQETPKEPYVSIFDRETSKNNNKRKAQNSSYKIAEESGIL